MRMYLDDLNNPEELPLLDPDTRKVQWLDNKGEPVDYETSALADRYTEYAMMCRVGGEKPMEYADWLEFDKKYQEHLRTAGSPLSPVTFQRMQEMADRASPSVSELQAEVETKTTLIGMLREESCNLRSEKDKVVFDLEDTIFELESSRDSLREANSALALRCQELVNSYEEQKAELWKKIEGLRNRVEELTSEPEVVRLTKERDDLAKDLTITVNHKNAAERFTQTLRDELGSLKREALFNKQVVLENEVLIKERDDLLCRLESLENEICRRKNLMKELKSQQEELLQTRHELILENEELASELETLKSAVGQRTTPANQPLFPHYYREVPAQTQYVDVYWCLRAWSVTDPCVAHAVKKLMCLGQRGVKGNLQDLLEARNSLNRAIELEETK